MSSPYLVDAEPVRQHWLRLRAIGMSDDEIERAAGVSHMTGYHLHISHWRGGEPIKRIKRETAERVLSVRRRSPKAGTLTAVDEVHEWLLDLMGLGYSLCWVSEQLGSQRINFFRRGKRFVTATLYAKVKRLWETTTEPRQANTPHERAVVTRVKQHAESLRRERNRVYRLDADKVRSLMDFNGLSALDVDAACGFARSTLTQMLGRGRASEQSLCRIASALGVREDDIGEVA